MGKQRIKLRKQIGHIQNEFRDFFPGYFSSSAQMIVYNTICHNRVQGMREILRRHGIQNIREEKT